MLTARSRVFARKPRKVMSYKVYMGLDKDCPQLENNLMTNTCPVLFEQALKAWQNTQHKDYIATKHGSHLRIISLNPVDKKISFSRSVLVVLVLPLGYLDRTNLLVLVLPLGYLDMRRMP